MNRALLIVLALMAAFALGTGSASYAVNNWQLFASKNAGPWQRLKMLNASNTNLYARAFEHTSTQLPMSSAEGQLFIAAYDDENQPLDAKCNYVLIGEIPAARLFTLRAETPGVASNMRQSPLNSVLHSDQMLFLPDQFIVNISATAQPDNWLALQSSEQFSLILAFYDVAVINDDTGNSASLPRIQKQSCLND